MSGTEQAFHEEWLGLVQPSEGLVVSIPVLVEAQCMQRLGREAQEKLAALVTRVGGAPLVAELSSVCRDLLELDESRFDAGEALPKPLRLYVPEGRQELRPTRALRWGAAGAPSTLPPGRANLPGTAPAADSTAAAEAGKGYAMLVWEVPPEVDDLDKPETVTGSWEYPARAKFERLLRECRVPIGLLSNGRELRLFYAPHGESTGTLSFRVADMLTTGGRPIVDALVMLLGRERWFSVSEEQSLPALLARSRRYQTGVTNALAGQVFEALEELLRGFVAASERARHDTLREALEREGSPSHVYSGLLTLLLRLVFVLYAEDRGLLPTASKLYAGHYSVLGLFDELERAQGRYPDSMHLRFGAYSRLVSLFRLVYFGAKHGDLDLPERRGDLFDPNRFPFLEGWQSGSAPVRDGVARAQVDVPAVDDGTVYRVLRGLLVLGGQRLSYRALDVEQIGSVYEALMGFDVERLVAPAVRLRLGSNRTRVWLTAKELLALPAGRREKHLTEELGFDKGVAAKLGKAVGAAQTEEQALTALEALAPSKDRLRVPAGTLVIQPGPERRRTSSHYTPRSLCEPIVARTLEPLMRALGDRPRSENILRLVVCDPAMGSGAFLVAACRYLADQVVAAWTRESAEGLPLFDGLDAGAVPDDHAARGGKTKLALLADAKDDVVNHARRLVAQRCLYGVDKNPFAVELARLSLWLVTLARDEPFTFVDHALRYGDSLVGLSFDQIRAFHWKPEKQLETTDRALKQALDEAISLRQEILGLAGDSSREGQARKYQLLSDATDALDRVRLIGDLVVGAFFAHEKDKEREKERNERLRVVEQWLAAKDTDAERELEAELRAKQDELRRTQVPFHWMVEFPEVFYIERADPLDGGKVNGAAFVDAFVGNPPFAGKNGISESGGPQYLPWLQSQHEGAHGNADLSAHFYRRAGHLIGNHGALGLIATNTIGQGDTRATGLQHLVAHGFSIFDATVNLPWPGEAAVTVSVVQLATGNPSRLLERRLDGQRVLAINSRLRAKPERADPKALASNADLSFQGSIVLGMGFTLTEAERDGLIAKSARNAERIFPYLGGEEVNTSPTQSHERYVISFGQMDLAEAEAWPDLISIVRDKVKPERDENKRDVRRIYWWRFGETAPALYATIAPLSRCLVTARVTKHLCFSFQPTNRVLNEKIYVFPFDKYTPFAVLQSRIHNAWTWLLSSTLEERLNYSASDCFETFPFPLPDPRSVIPELEAIGEALYEARAAYMRDTDQGLTKTYNALKDPGCDDPRILALRAQHEDLDRAVLRAYPRLPGMGSPDTIGWSDLTVPTFCIASPEDAAKLAAFEDEIIDRLFVLNEQRAREEAALGRAGQATKGKRAPKAAAKSTAGASSETEPTPRAKRGRKKPPPEGQGSLGLG
jgi:hypothetical protein